VIRLRGVERSDLDALFTLDQQCFSPGIAYTKAELRYYLRHPDSFSVVAEDSAAVILGFAIAESYPEANGRIGHIVTIDVAQGARRQGVGRMLMEAILDGLRAVDTVAVRLEVAVDNGGAQAFYRNFGFVESERIRGYYLGTLDAFSMEKVF
jgi:[ribosomal protein S18]-alanine N-acetyltransferase